MGFGNQADVADFKKQSDDYELAKAKHKQDIENRTLANRYALLFLNYRFISIAVMRSVMDKYGLEVRETNDFIGTIPDKNVEDMACFRQVLTKPAQRDAVAETYVIAATPDQFVARTYRVGVRSMTEAEFKNWLIEDPIVLAQVKTGFLIVTAWGDEAKDPDALNELNN